MSVLREPTNTTGLAAKSGIKCSVAKAKIVSASGNRIVLRTQAMLKLRPSISSGDSAMLDQQALAKVGQAVEGTVCIEAVSDDVIRVRYVEGSKVLENDTEMVVGKLAKPRTCKFTRGNAIVSLGENASSPTITMTTAKLRVLVSLDPYRIEIRDKKGNVVCGVGGPEKDNFVMFDTYNTGIARFGKDNAPVATENFDLAPDEAIYGLGEQFIKLNKVGQTIELNMCDALGVTTPRAYKNVPFYVSTRGYGVFFNHSSIATVWVGAMSSADIQWGLDDDFLDYYIFAGDIKHVLARYTDLTGKGVLPPQWTFGFWQSKISYKSADETLEIVRQMRKHEIPCDVIHLDTHWFEKDWICDLEFAKDRFPDPKAYFEQLAQMGIKVSLWQLPYITEGSKLFDDILKVDGFVKDSDGRLYGESFCGDTTFKKRVGIVDYSNPKAVEVQMGYFRKLFRMGAKVIKTDFGEAAPVAGVYANGLPGRQNHNLYPLLYNKALFNCTKEETGDGVVWARSAWAGSQRYPLHWGGDNSPNHFNMLPQLEGGLSFGLSGFQFWSQDIGGFCGNTNDKLLIRWMQIGMFLSHSRIHGSGDREVYKFKPETMRICREYIRLRYRLMPYIYAQARECVEQSLPMLRAMVVEYGNDPATHNMGDQYLFGSDILVAPIFSENPVRRVYLPEGVWTNWWDHQRFEGPAWVEVETDIETMPLFIREGGLIPMGPVMNYVGEKKTEQVDLLVSLFEGPGKTSLKVPINNKWVPVTYVSTGKKHTVTIGKSDAKWKVTPLGKGKVTVKSR